MRRALLCHAKRSFSTRMQASKDWSAKQYLKFEDERTIPVRDLLAKVPLQKPRKIIDLGCGPGNSTAVLAKRYPDTEIIGMDSSPDMLQKARSTLPQLKFEQGDLTTYEPPSDADLLFSNAVFQWLKEGEMLPTMQRLLKHLKPGGVLAVQVPDTYEQTTHKIMRDVGRDPDWEGVYRHVPDMPPMPTTMASYEALSPLCFKPMIWRTNYQHILESPEAIVEWVKGTGMRPYLDPLSDEQKRIFTKRYLEAIEPHYPRMKDGRVILSYQRLFMVAVRGED